MYDYETYKAMVLEDARLRYGHGYATFCTDTIDRSYRDQLTVAEAADAVYDDTMYWAGDWFGTK